MQHSIKNTFFLVVFSLFSCSVLGDSIERLKERYDNAECGNSMQSLWDEARNGEAWETLTPVIKSQILQLEKIHQALIKRRIDSEKSAGNSESKLAFEQEIQLKQFHQSVYKAIYGRLFRSPTDSPTFSESQITRINKQILRQSLDIESINQSGLI
jgi:hypothetical protein